MILKGHENTDAIREIDSAVLPGQVLNSSENRGQEIDFSDSKHNGEPDSKPDITQRSSRRALELEVTAKMLIQGHTKTTGEHRAPLQIQKPPLIQRWQSKLNYGVSLSNIVTAILVSNSDIDYRVVVITGGGLAQWLLRLNGLLDRIEHNKDRLSWGVMSGVLLTCSVYPATMYFFLTSNANEMGEKICAVLSYAAPFACELLIQKWLLPKNGENQILVSERLWSYFFFNRFQFILKVAGLADQVLNNICAGLWMSNARLIGRFWATTPNMLFTALSAIAALKNDERRLEAGSRVGRFEGVASFSLALSQYYLLLSVAGISSYLTLMLCSWLAASDAMADVESGLTFALQLILGGASFGFTQRYMWEMIQLSNRTLAAKKTNQAKPSRLRGEEVRENVSENLLSSNEEKGEEVLHSAQTLSIGDALRGAVGCVQSGAGWVLSLFQCGGRRRRIAENEIQEFGNAQ